MANFLFNYHNDPKIALITGITGQDGSYLAELLLEKGYEVQTIVRRSSSFNTGRIDHLYLHNEEYRDRRVFVYYGDVTDPISVTNIVEKSQPDEINNLAAKSHVKVSFDVPHYTASVDALGTLNFLEAIRQSGRPMRFYQASTSELFGKVQETPQTENTPFYPRSPYGVAKLYGFWIVKNYREAYGTYACNGILFNHESPRRGESFVTRKITLGVARIKHRLQDKIVHGNLDSKRDWGNAPEYVDAMWRMLQCPQPGHCEGRNPQRARVHGGGVCICGPLLAPTRGGRRGISATLGSRPFDRRSCQGRAPARLATSRKVSPTRAPDDGG